MNWQEFTALLVLATAMSFSPGPNTTLATALAANVGLRRAMHFVYAVPVGWSMMLLLTVVGLGTLVHTAPALRVAIQAAGVAYLLWLAFKLSRSRQLGQADSTRLQVSFWQGVGLQFINIKAWMLALALVAGWLAGKPEPVQRTALLLSVTLVLAFASNLLYAAVGALLRGWLAQGTRLLWFNRGMAGVLVLTAGWMVTTA